MRVAEWLLTRPEVKRVMYPALPDDPGHAIWSRDFTGACALFGVELAVRAPAALAAFIDTLELFGLGASWGGYESLVLPARFTRTVRPFAATGTLVRLHIGLEDPEDLIADLATALAAMRAAEAAARRKSG